jgi:hypothetical protein
MVDRYYSAKKLIAPRVYEILAANAAAMEKFGLDAWCVEQGLEDKVTRERTVTSVRLEITKWGGVKKFRDALRAKDPGLAFLLDIPFAAKRKGPVVVRNLFSMEPS